MRWVGSLGLEEGDVICLGEVEGFPEVEFLRICLSKAITLIGLYPHGSSAFVRSMKRHILVLSSFPCYILLAFATGWHVVSM